MKDEGQEATERAMREFSTIADKLYTEVEKQALSAARAFLRRLKEQDNSMLEKVERGEIDVSDWINWRIGKFGGSDWAALVEEVATKLHLTNAEAVDALGGFILIVYAENYNWGIFIGDKQVHASIRFDLYDERVIEHIKKRNPDILKDYGKNIDSVRDIEWNKRKINGVVQRAIINGDKLDDVAKSLRQVTDMNRASAYRTARTSMTAAQNGGRLEAWREYERQGIHVLKKWRATHDMRTRHTHALQDGEERGLDERFSNDCMYPADPDGKAGEIYNCRCTMMCVMDDVDYGERAVNETFNDGTSRMNGMTYEEWIEYHRKRVKM